MGALTLNTTVFFRRNFLKLLSKVFPLKDTKLHSTINIHRLLAESRLSFYIDPYQSSIDNFRANGFLGRYLRPLKLTSRRLLTGQEQGITTT